jgi:O-antigen ligase
MNIFVKVLSFLYSIFFIFYVSSIVVVYEINLSQVYYVIAALWLALLLVLTRFNTFRINIYILLFIFASLLSIVFNDIPEFFSSNQRLVAFLLMISLIGPFFFSDKLASFKLKLFSYINLLIILFSVSSLPLHLIGIFHGIPDKPFTGLFNHSMFLGPMAGIAILYMLYLINSNKVKLKYVFYILIFISFITCIYAGSRIAVLSLIGGILTYYFLYKNKKTTRFFTSIVFLFIVILFSYPIWNDYTENIMNKISSAQESGDITSSRTNLWNARLTEFSSSPIVGIGFASVNVDLNEEARFDEETGKVEPGSSWLAILSMTGILGFLFFFIMFVKYFLFIWKKANSNNIYLCLLGSLLVFYAIHMLGEGYIISSGSGLFFYFWLLLGVIDIYNKEI